MKKIASHVVFLALAISVAHAFAGDAETAPLRLTPTKIPKCSKAHVCKDLPYGGRQVGKGAVHADVAQTYDLYLPGAVGEIDRAAPFYLFVHGGAWMRGSKGGVRSKMFAEMAEQGFVVASMNYVLCNDKLGGTHTFAEMLADIDAMVSHLPSLAKAAGISIPRIALGGNSAGGHLVLLYAYDGANPSVLGLGLKHAVPVACVFTDCGPSDIASPEFIVAGLDWMKGSFDNWCGLLCVLAGGKHGQEDVRTTVERLTKYSPITLLNGKCPPTICLFGETGRVKTSRTFKRTKNGPEETYADFWKLVGSKEPPPKSVGMDGIVATQNYVALTNGLARAGVPFAARLEPYSHCKILARNPETRPWLYENLRKYLKEGNASEGRMKAVPSKKTQVNFTRQRVFPGFDGRLCKIQPSIATDGNGTALLGFQKLLLTGSDVFYGQFLSKSVDDGKTWSEPVGQTALADTVENGLRAARYATVRYSRAHRKWFALGMKQLYENDKVPFQKYVDGRPYGVPIYVSVDIGKGCFAYSRPLAFPFGYEMALPFGQMLECENGDLLACFYYRPVGAGKKGRCVTVRYSFEEDGLRVVKAGTPVVRDDLARGVGEPSLARFGDKVYMTLRSDEMGLWCVSDDGGMTFSAPRPWTWTDGRRIGNKNTQQHWMMCGGELFLAYTREDSANGHVFRNRAPIYMAQFDSVCGGLVRNTEFPLVPELGARLGNFCVDFTGDESWLVTAEWMQPLGCEKYGSDNSIWLVRAK